MIERLNTSEFYKHVNEPGYYDRLRAQADNPPVHEVSEDLYNYMLEVLPPMKWRGINGFFETFCMLEASSCNFHRQFARLGRGKEARYYTREVDPQNEATWITPHLIEELNAEVQS